MSALTIIHQILASLHLLGWVGLGMLIASPATAIAGYMMFSGSLYSRPNLAAGGLILIIAAFALIGAGAVLVRVG